MTQFENEVIQLLTEIRNHLKKNDKPVLGKGLKGLLERMEARRAQLEENREQILNND